MTVPIVLIVTLQILSSSIQVHYIAENTTKSMVYLVNHMTRYQAEKGWVPDASVAYVFVEKQGEGIQVEITKRVPQTPDQFVNALRSYYVTPLKPGERFEETVTLPLPLQEYHPYRSFVKERPLAQRVDATLRFVLGAFLEHPSLKAKPVVVHGISTHQLVSVRGTSAPEGALMSPPAEILIVSEPQHASFPLIALPQ